MIIAEQISVFVVFIAFSSSAPPIKQSFESKLNEKESDKRFGNAEKILNRNEFEDFFKRLLPEKTANGTAQNYVDEEIQVELLSPILEDALLVVKNSLPDFRLIIDRLPDIVSNMTFILNQNKTSAEKARAIDNLRAKNPVGVDVIFFIASELSKSQEWRAFKPASDSTNLTFS